MDLSAYIGADLSELSVDDLARIVHHGAEVGLASLSPDERAVVEQAEIELERSALFEAQAVRGGW